MGGESEAAWRALLDDLLKARLATPELAIVDGAPGLEKALHAGLVGCFGPALHGALCRCPDYADHRGQTGLGGGDRCGGRGIILTAQS